MSNDLSNVTQSLILSMATPTWINVVHKHEFIPMWGTGTAVGQKVINDVNK